MFCIQAIKNVKLSNIVRSLKENISLIKTEDGLSRNLDDFNCKHNAKITYFKEGKEKVKNISYSSVVIKTDDLKDQELNIVIVKGFWQVPVLILTNKSVNNIVPETVWKIIEIYLTRRKCEEFFRYIKQSYNLEYVRVRSYIGIRNIVVIVLAIAYFTTICIGKNLKLKRIFEKTFFMSKRCFGIPVLCNG